MIAVSKAAYQIDRLHQIDNAIVLEDYSTAPPTLTDKARFGFDSQRILDRCRRAAVRRKRFSSSDQCGVAD